MEIELQELKAEDVPRRPEPTDKERAKLSDDLYKVFKAGDRVAGLVKAPELWNLIYLNDAGEPVKVDDLATGRVALTPDGAAAFVYAGSVVRIDLRDGNRRTAKFLAPTKGIASVGSEQCAVLAYDSLSWFGTNTDGQFARLAESEPIPEATNVKVPLAALEDPPVALVLTELGRFQLWACPGESLVCLGDHDFPAGVVLVEAVATDSEIYVMDAAAPRAFQIKNLRELYTDMMKREGDRHVAEAAAKREASTRRGSASGGAEVTIIPAEGIGELSIPPLDPEGRFPANSQVVRSPERVAALTRPKSKPWPTAVKWIDDKDKVKSINIAKGAAEVRLAKGMALTDDGSAAMVLGVGGVFRIPFEKGAAAVLCYKETSNTLDTGISRLLIGLPGKQLVLGYDRRLELLRPDGDELVLADTVEIGRGELTAWAVPGSPVMVLQIKYALNHTTQVYAAVDGVLPRLAEVPLETYSILRDGDRVLLATKDGPHEVAGLVEAGLLGSTRD